MIELDITERWPEIEPRIIEKPDDAARYAIGLKFRWPEAEPAILGKVPQSLLRDYIRACVKERWEEAETVLNSSYLISYALTYVRGRVPAIEKKILDEAIKNQSRGWESGVTTEDLAQYSIKVIGGRWPEFESLCDRTSSTSKLTALIGYAEHHRFRWDKLENMLAKSGGREAIISYTKRALHGQRSLVFEQFFENNPEYSAAFKQYCDLVDWSRPDTGPISDFVAKRMKRWMKAGANS